MSPAEMQKFFSTMVSEAVLYPEKAALFRSLGFDPSDWPDCPARPLMGEFVSITKEKGEDAARFVVAQLIKGLQTFEALPEDQGELSIQYERARVYGHAMQLSDLIRAQPFDLDQILEDFKRKKPSRVETFLLHEAIDETMDEAMKKIEQGEIRVLINGWEKLSRKIGGFNPGRVSMLVAKTGIGKTMLALNMATAASEHMAVAFFNMEMSKKDIMSRVIQSGAKIKSEDWYSGHWKFDGISEFRDKAQSRKPVMMTDGRALTLNQIIGQIVIAREKHGIQFVVVDYDQKIRMSGRDEEWRQIQRAVEDLEECAKSNSVHIMLLAQGDDDGAVKASKRAQQPAATIFEFTETNGKYAIVSKKNRFGARRWRMTVTADPSMSLVTEGELTDDAQLEMKVPGEAGDKKNWWEKENL